MRRTIALLALSLAACAPGPGPASSPAAPTAAGSSASARAEFTSMRDAICVAGSDDIAAINATMEAMSGEQLSLAVRQVADRIRAAQADLDAIPAPAELAEFVAADHARRARRLDLVEQLAVAVVDDPGAVDSIDAALTALNIETEREEDAQALRHCP